MNFNLTQMPDRTSKPRSNGLTMVMDKGMGLSDAKNFLEIATPHIDLVKLGFGTSHVTPNLRKKIEAYKQAHELGEENLGYIITDLQQSKSAWLKGAEYLDHFYIEYCDDYYNRKNEMENFKTKLSLHDADFSEAEKLTLHYTDINFFTHNQKITYLNMSSYKLFLN